MDINSHIKAIDQHVMATIEITSRQGMIERGGPPNFTKLMLQLVANQVVIMQELKALLLVMAEPDKPQGQMEGGKHG